MRRLFRYLLRFIFVVVIATAAFWFFGPREPVETDIAFNTELSAETVGDYFANTEARFADITPGTEKRVIWAGEAGRKTPVSVVYIHGFSATSEELRPVPDRVAKGLSANLVFTRLSGHGRSGDAMAEPTAGDWIEDTAEALAAARAVGDKVIVIATSTGGTLAALAAVDDHQMQAVAGIAFVSPNFQLITPTAKALTWPGARWWGPIIAGAVRSFETANERHAKYWTTRYPTVSVLPMAALVKHTVAQDFSKVKTPALFLFSPADEVVSADMTRRVAAHWGAAAILSPQELLPGSDPYNHLIAGDILSPGMTGIVSQQILSWAKSLGL